MEDSVSREQYDRLRRYCESLEAERDDFAYLAASAEEQGGYLSRAIRAESRLSCVRGKVQAFLAEAKRVATSQLPTKQALMSIHKKLHEMLSDVAQPDEQRCSGCAFTKRLQQAANKLQCELDQIKQPKRVRLEEPANAAG